MYKFIKYPKNRILSVLVFMSWLLGLWVSGFVLLLIIGTMVMVVTGKSDPLGESIILLIVYFAASIFFSINLLIHFLKFLRESSREQSG